MPKPALCGICGYEAGNAYALVTLQRDGTRYKPLRICGLCFTDATLEAVERNTTWSTVTFSLGRKP